MNAFQAQRLRKGMVTVAIVCSVASAGAVAAKTVTLSFLNWDVGTQYAQFQNQFIERFEKENPGIKVKMTSGPWADPAKLLLMLSAGTPPDIIWPESFELGWYVQRGLLLDLTPYQKLNPTPTDWNKAWNSCVYTNKKLYALPYDTAAYHVLYNKDLFNNAGIVMPDESWTWDTYAALSAKLTKMEGGVVKQVGGQLPSGWPAWGFLRSFGATVVSPNGLDTGIDSPEAIKSYQWMRSFINTTMSGRYSWGTPSNGKVAMWWEGNWALEQYARTLKVNYDVAKWPKGPEGRFVSLINTNWAIPKSSKHPKEAWKFINFANSDWAVKFWAETRIYPARSQFARFAGSGLRDESFKRVIVDQMNEYGYVEKPAPWLPQARIDMDGATINLWNGIWGMKKDISDVAASAAKYLRTNNIKRWVK